MGLTLVLLLLLILLLQYPFCLLRPLFPAYISIHGRKYYFSRLNDEVTTHTKKVNQLSSKIQNFDAKMDCVTHIWIL